MRLSSTVVLAGTLIFGAVSCGTETSPRASAGSVSETNATGSGSSPRAPEEPGASVSGWANGDPLASDASVVKVLPADLKYSRTEHAAAPGTAWRTTMIWFESSESPDRYVVVSITTGMDPKNWMSELKSKTAELAQSTGLTNKTPAPKVATVNGVDAVFLYSPPLFTDRAQFFGVSWSPASGVVLGVGGTGLSEDEQLSIANGISK